LKLTDMMAAALQNTFENYAQTANWGTDQSFQFFSGNADLQQQQQQQQQQQSPQQGSADGASFGFGNASAPNRG